MRRVIQVGATLGLAFVMWLSVTQALAAQEVSRSVPVMETAVANCHIQAITLTANLGPTPGVSDTVPYAGEGTRTVYVANVLPGTLIVTVEVSDFPGGNNPCYLWGGRFGSTDATMYTLSAAKPVTDIVYSVNNSALDPTLNITSSKSASSNADVSQASLTIMRDITAPQITNNLITKSGNHLVANGTNLYYASTVAITETFQIKGTSIDNGAGLARTTFAGANLGCSPEPQQDPNWSAAYCFNGVPNPTSGVLTATSSDWVGNNASAVFTYSLDNTPPTATMSPLPSEWTNQSIITLTWVSTDTQSGVRSTQLWARNAAQSDWQTAGSPGVISGAINYRLTDEGQYFFTPVAVDNLGNAMPAPSLATSYSVTARMDTMSPQVTLTVPSVVTATGANATFNLHVDAVDAGSGFEMFTVTRQVNNGLPTVWLTGTTSSMNKTDTISPGNQIVFEAWAQDKIGNVSNPIRQQVRVVPYRIYLPILLRNYAPFINGGFEDALIGWQTNGQMSVSTVDTPTTPAASLRSARLGGDDQVYADGQVPTGYGAAWQSFSVPNTSAPKMIVRYRVRTHDAMVGTTKYYDDFELSIDRAPVDVTDSERDALGCRSTTPLSSTFTAPVPAAGGLAVCDGNRGTPTKLPTLYDTDWRTVTLDLSQVKAKGNITVYLANWNRNDRFWNTWTYVDSIELIP